MVTLLLTLAAAQATSAQMLEEQLISAYPAPTPLISSPEAASVFPINELDRFGINTTAELALRSPGLLALRQGDGLQLRGIGGPTAGGQAPAVPLFSDGVYLGEATAADAANFFDLERIEVKRGPGGVSSGYNALGGAINLQTAAPTATWQSRVVADVGSDDYHALQGLIRGPITDQFSMSVAGSTLSQSPWEDRGRETGDRGERDNQYLRGAFTYHWTNLFYSRLQIIHSETADSDLDSAYLLNEVALGDHRLKYLASWYQRGGNRETESTVHELRWYSDSDGKLEFDNGLYWYQRDSEAAARPATKTQALSAWTQLNLSLADAMQLRGGLRYTDEERKAEQTQEDGYWDWRLGLDYTWRDQLLYAETSSGHGNVGGEKTVNADSEIDSLTSLTLGHKGQYLGGRLQTAAAIYHYDLVDLEGGGHASGLETELRWAWNEQLSLGGSWAYNSGALPAPRHQVALFTSFQWRWGWAQMAAVLEYFYRDSYCSQSQPCRSSRNQWDSSLSASYGLWRLTAYVDNLGDERSASDSAEVLPGGGLEANQVDPPRSVGLRLAYQL